MRPPLCVVLLCLASLGWLQLPAQEIFTYTWDKTGLMIDLPLGITSTVREVQPDIEEEGDVVWIKALFFEIEMMAVPLDSVSIAGTDTLESLLNAVVSEYELIVLGRPEPLEHVAKGKYLTAVDTFLFLDSVVVGVIINPADTGRSILAVIDCYEIPLATGISIMKGIRFKDMALRKETD